MTNINCQKTLELHISAIPVQLVSEEFSLNIIMKNLSTICVHHHVSYFNTLRLTQNGCHLADDLFKCIFLKENIWILIKISLNFVPKGPINNIPALVQVMAWCRPGDKPLSKTMMVRLTMPICVTQPQWVKKSYGQMSSSSLNISYLQSENSPYSISTHLTISPWSYKSTSKIITNYPPIP